MEKKRERRERSMKGRNPSGRGLFSEIENGTPRNSALSTDQSEISEENGANLFDREVLISGTVLCQYEWENKNWAWIQQLAIARVLSIPVSMAAPYVLLTGCVNINNIRSRLTL